MFHIGLARPKTGKDVFAAQKTGIDVKGSFHGIPVHHFYQTDILHDPVIIAEGKGPGEAARPVKSVA